MKTNELIKLANKREKREYPLFYGKHKSQEFIVYDKAAIYLVKKGTTKLLRETTTDKKRIKKLVEPSKSLIGIIETKINSEHIISAEITGEVKLTKAGAEVVLIKSDNEEKWVNIKYLSYFSPKRKAYFNVSGWKDNIVYITETETIVGAICTIASESVIVD